MKFSKLNNPNSYANINVLKYKVDWDGKQGSKPENTVKKFLKPFWKNDLVLVEMLIPGSLLRVDFINISKGIAIEVSPEATHTKFNPFMHGTRAGYLGVIKRDLAKEEWILSQNWKYICLIDEDINNLSKKLFEEKFEVYL